MSPLTEAFGAPCPCYKLSLSKTDYTRDDGLKQKTLETAQEIYDRFLDVPPLDCQKMVSLETRIKLLIKDHVQLEELNKETTEKLEREVADHKATQAVLDDTNERLENTMKELQITHEKLKLTLEDLDRWREKHGQCFQMLERESA